MEWNELVNFGDTNLSFSPSIVASNMFLFEPINNFNVGFLSKYVGEQYGGTWRLQLLN